MGDQQVGRIASRPRWRASPRALLHGLGLSALITCAACEKKPPQLITCRDNATREDFTFFSDRQDSGRNWSSFTDVEGRQRIFSGHYSLTCDLRPKGAGR